MVVAVAVDGGIAGCTDDDAAMAAMQVGTSIVSMFSGVHTAM
jgi:hypothetical protein